MPASIVPISCARPSARAALMVMPASASSGVRPNRVQAMFIASVGVSSGEVPGLQSVAMAIGTPGVAQQIDRRLLRFLERVEGAGEQHRDRAGRGHRLGAGGVEMLEMVGRQRLVLGGERGAVLVAEAARRGGGPARPWRGAAVNTRSTSAGVKAMVSQKASTLVARPGLGDGGDHLLGDHPDDRRRGRLPGSGGSAWSASRVGDDPHRLARADARGRR